MADFSHTGFSWFIALTTLLGIIGLFLLAYRLSGRRPADDHATSGHVWDEDLEEYNHPLPRWWLNLFYLTLGWGVLYLLAYPGLGAMRGFLGWTQLDQYDKEMAHAERQYQPLFDRFLAVELNTLSHDAQAITVGARLFNNHCATCHGADAGGARGFPNLRDQDWLYGDAPEVIKATIVQGRHGVMPPWQSVLDEAKLKQVTAYVESLSGRATDDIAALAGAPVFTTFCAACHGADGSGNQLLGAPNLTDDIWLHGGSTERITDSIARGRTGVMPAHKDLLGEAKAHVLAAYVLALQHSTVPRHVED